jgi:hypothetical protein
MRGWLVAAVLVGCGGQAQETPTPPPQPPPQHQVASSAPPVEAHSTPPECTPAAPVAPPDAGVTDDYKVVDRIATPQNSKDFCATADSNIARAEKAIAGWPAPTENRKSWAKWDGKSKPERLEAVSRRLGLAPDEIAALRRNGFVVPARLEWGTYAWAYHEVYQSQLPIFVSIDSILHAIYVGHDTLLAGIEEKRLLPLLREALHKMHCALGAAGFPAEQTHDLDVYLTVARRLLDKAAPNDDEAGAPP